MDTTTKASESEEAGLGLIPQGAKNIYSVGISTAGVAEVRMAHMRPQAHVIATTIDKKGIEDTSRLIAEAGLSQRIETKIEDVSQLLPYADRTFDYIYARLVLHYLPKPALTSTLDELYRVLKPGGTFFVVVRSTECPDAKHPTAMFDPETHLTRYVLEDDKIRYRYFHTQTSICEALKRTGFKVQSVREYDEQLFHGYERQKKSSHVDNVIEVVVKR
ncbi:MAG TPA: methyltransferase domain-containing protein [Candidatus Saccharimonadales bacterium]|jgi:ubiquinone/menaquinone biosynthesis C-methylase UbiE